MRQLSVRWFLCLVSCLLFSNLYAERVLWVPMKGTVELGLSPYIKRAIERAEAEKYDALVLEIDTFGGRVDAAVEIRDALLETKIPTTAWVNKRAISAGALISLACDTILFAPASTMGAATPIQLGQEGAKPVENKFVSYFRAEMGATAERNGRSRKIAEAMVSATDEIKGLVKKDEVLTLTDRTAYETKISNGTAESRDEVFKFLKLKNPSVTEFQINWAERVVRFITDPTVSGLLMSAGVLGVFFELQAPGLGLPGLIGVTALGLFFFGKFMVHLAGWEEVLLLILGFGLVAIEFFLLPGHIIPGVIGAVLIATALLLAGISPKLPFTLDGPEIQSHLTAMTFAVIALFVGVVSAYFWISRNPKKSPLVLQDELSGTEGYQLFSESSSFVGKTGVTTTALRPTGKALVAGETIEVSFEGGFLDEGVQIEVVEHDGPRIVVKRIG